MPAPFSYPVWADIRQRGPRGYARHDGFRPWLRDEFEFRCVFCLHLNCQRLVHFHRPWLQSFAIADTIHPDPYREPMCYPLELPKLHVYAN